MSSSPQVLKRSLLRLPDGHEVETVVLRRADGSITVRKADELGLVTPREEILPPPAELEGEST